jgi:hypothetical protein
VIGQPYPDEENRGKRREMIEMLFYSKSKEAEKLLHHLLTRRAGYDGR